MSEHRSWGATLSEHFVWILLFTITGPLTIFYGVVSLVYWVRHRSTTEGVDAFRIGMVWIVYGFVWAIILVI